MIYTVRHLTRYAYGNPVDLGAHQLHLRPRTLPWQRVLRAALTIDPAPARQDRRLDDFGNETDWLYLDDPHPSLSLTLDAVVDVHAPHPPDPDATPPWEEVARAALSRDGLEAAEFLFDSPLAICTPDARAFAAESFPEGRPILAGLLELKARIRQGFAFKGGVTGVGTSVAQVMRLRAGVCQDFAHVMVAGLRGLGLPARYVSGYIRTYAPPGQAKRLGCDASHAWIGAWMGPHHGWIDLDPTNDLVIAEEHVVLGWGRDYSDICPVRGIILGGGRHSVHVGVDLLPEPAEPRSRPAAY